MFRDLRPEVTITAVIAFGITWIAASAVSLRLLSMAFFEALLTGLVLSLLHWMALFVHHLGHALAARSASSPMVGVRLWWWLGTSLYPRDEAALPAATHIRRALGGPLASVAFALIAAGLAFALLAGGSPLWIALAFVAFDSFLVFGAGSLIPLGFNNGSTLIKWSARRCKT